MTICDQDDKRLSAPEVGDDATDHRTETIVQQLYATGLSLQMCLDGASTANQRHRLERAIDVLDGLITELGSQPLGPRSSD